MLPLSPSPATSIPDGSEPEHEIPSHVGSHGSVVVTPELSHDHWVKIDSIFVAAMKPHKPISVDVAAAVGAAVGMLVMVEHE